VYDALRYAIAQDDYKHLKMAMKRVAELAADGDKWACEFIRDTLDGRPKQLTELSGPDGGDIPLKGILEFVRSPQDKPAGEA